MLSRHVAASLCLLALAACSESTTPPLDGTIVTDAPELGGRLTIAGASGLGSAGVAGISGAVLGSPFALVAGPGQLPPPPTCTNTAPIVCTSNVNGLTITYTIGMPDSLGTRSETTMSGTIAATGNRAEQRINRRATIWTQPLSGGSQTFVAMRHRSVENGTHELLATPRVVSTDTGSADLRFVLHPFVTPDSRIPRMVGTSRRVIWTSRGGAPATFWRETTTYDSTTVIRSEIETPAGTRRCSIDLAATVIALTCQ